MTFRPSAQPERWLLDLPNGPAMAFRRIPAGTFRMGSRGTSAREEPSHVVRIVREFWLAETPVTQGQFGVWTAAEGIRHENDFKGQPDHPAESLDWREANRYCAWLTGVWRERLEKGWKACLPTEAEWEYACRAGTETEYYSGDGEAALAEAGWYSANSESTTHPVGMKAANGWGLHDLHGNVWEWCHDVWVEDGYRERVDGDGDSGFERRASEWKAGLESMVASGEYRVLRGGSWHGTAGYCRSALRSGLTPDYRFRFLGLRVCLVPGPGAETGRGAPGETAGAERAAGDGGRGTSPESEGASGATDLAGAHFPAKQGRDFC